MYLIYTSEYEKVILGLLFNKNLIDDSDLRSAIEDENLEKLFNTIAFSDSTDWRNPPDLLSPPIPPSPTYDEYMTSVPLSGWLDVPSDFAVNQISLEAYKKINSIDKGNVPAIEFLIHFQGSDSGWDCQTETLDGNPNVLKISVPVPPQINLTQTILGYKVDNNKVIPLIYISHPTILINQVTDSYYMRHKINMFIPSIYRV